MDCETLRDYCRAKPGVTEGFPFDETTMVFRVGSKIFALTGLHDGCNNWNLKCDPDQAEVLRDVYSEVQPGYHMNKRHWNTVAIDGAIPDEEILAMVDHSYDLVYKSLPKREK